MNGNTCNECGKSVPDGCALCRRCHGVDLGK